MNKNVITKSIPENLSANFSGFLTAMHLGINSPKIINMNVIINIIINDDIISDTLFGILSEKISDKLS